MPEPLPDELRFGLPTLNDALHGIHLPESQSDADAGINALANTYQNTSSPQVLFVSLTDLTTACVSTGSFTLIVNPLPSFADLTKAIKMLNAVLS